VKKKEKYRFASFAAPITCLAIAIGLGYSRSSRIQDVTAQTAVVSKGNSDVRLLIGDIEKRGLAGLRAVAPDTRNEQGEFVTSLRKAANEQHVSLTAWSVGSVSLITVPPSADASLQDLMTHVTPLCNQVTISGSFAHVRGFLMALLSQDRYVSLSGVKWSRGAMPPDTAITFLVTRYVSTAVASQAASPVVVTPVQGSHPPPV
jgi:hypothetical protein